jgi:hypothetical protein
MMHEAKPLLAMKIARVKKRKLQLQYNMGGHARICK